MHRRARRWNDALEQFARCEARLRDELGVAPEAETVALRDRVLRERDAAVGTGAGQGASSGATPRRSLAPARDEGRPTIAVLPFESLTEGLEHEHFADGVTEDITTELSRFPELFVIARNSAFAFKGRGATAEEVGRELAVQYLVTGSIRRADTTDLSTAERHNQRALELNPNDPRLVAQRGELLTWRGDARAAAESIELAMRLDPYGAGDFGHLLARAYLHLGEHARAIEAYRSSTYPRAYHHADMAACHTALAEAERADAAARRALELRPDFTADGYIDALPYDRGEDRERHRALLKAAPLP